MKVITICGSIKFMDEMKEIAEKMELAGNCMLTIIYPPKGKSKDDYTKEEFEMFDKMHLEKIKMSDAILVVDVGNYIGAGTQREIDFAKSLGKEIMYYSELVEKDAL